VLLPINRHALELGADHGLAVVVEVRIDVEGIVPPAAIRLDALDAGEIDQSAADHLNGRARDLEDIIQLGAIDDDGVEAIAAVDVTGAVLEIGDHVRADAAVHRGIAAGDDGVEHEDVVAIFTVEEQLGGIAVDLEVVVVIAAVDGHLEARALDQ